MRFCGDFLSHPNRLAGCVVIVGHLFVSDEIHQIIVALFFASKLFQIIFILRSWALKTDRIDPFLSFLFLLFNILALFGELQIFNPFASLLWTAERVNRISSFDGNKFTFLCVFRFEVWEDLLLIIFYFIFCLLQFFKSFLLLLSFYLHPHLRHYAKTPFPIAFGCWSVTVYFLFLSLLAHQLLISFFVFCDFVHIELQFLLIPL